MKKEIHIVKGLPSEDYKGFRERIFILADTLLDRGDYHAMRVNLTLKPPPRLSVIPFRRGKVAAISLTGEGPSAEQVVNTTEGYTGGYAVEEAIPVAYEKTWEDRSPTPGICMLTLFRRKPGIDHPTFLHRWHNGHTPLSLKLHPLWNYNRNVVLAPGTAGAESHEGIVEEQFRREHDLLNPLRFFGPPWRAPLHMLQVYRDTRSFIDMRTIEIYLTTEFHFKSNTHA
jgi:hypothetical protein